MLYHKNLGFPETLKLPTNRKKMVFTSHARKAAENDKYGNFSGHLRLHNSLDPNAAELVEAETSDGITATKVVYRVPLTPKSNKDLVLVVVPYDQTYVVKTVWLNESSDKHKTLNVGRYARP